MGKNQGRKHFRPRNPVKSTATATAATCMLPLPVPPVPSGTASCNSGSRHSAPAVERPAWQQWTGKTPVTMLNEYCQKNKRPRAVFSDAAAPRGLYRVRASLPARGPADAKDHLPSMSVVPEDAHEDAAFARHCAAVHLLRRLNPTLPLYRLMAPEFRTEWERCGTALQAEADSEARARAAAARKSEAADRADAKVRELEQLPIILMNDEARAAVAEVLQSTLGNLNNTRSSSQSSSSASSASSFVTLARQLKALGFASSDVDEALDQLPSDVAESDAHDAAIEWLCLNVDEADLPVAFRARGQMDVFLPSNKSTPAAPAAPSSSSDVATSTTTPTTHESRSLMRFGYDVRRVRRCARASATTTWPRRSSSSSWRRLAALRPCPTTMRRRC
jgi:hypothetical protein